MNLKTGKLLWPDTVADQPTYAQLTGTIDCDVLVIGGGVTGALCAHALMEQGVNTVIVDKRRIANGSSSANTGLLQFASDQMLTSCIELFGEADSVRFYQLCKEALDKLERITSSLEISPDYIRRNSLYYASCLGDVEKLKHEYNALKQAGFDVEWWDRQKVERHYSFSKDAAILCKGDAEINPFKFSLSLIKHHASRGMRVFEQSEIVSHKAFDDHIEFYTRGGRIRAKYGVFATGYESEQIKPNPNAELSSTYSIATAPVASFDGWHEQSLIWETARPYLYVRTTVDKRIIVGGLDEVGSNVRVRDALLPQKQQLLLAELKKLFPRIPNLRIDYSWSATFGGTVDGLPMIGAQPEFPRCYFALGYGGNGTAYSTIAAEIIRDLIVKGSHPDAHLFRFNRPIKQLQNV